MNNIGEKFLPIGSVVKITGNDRKIMITGFYKKNNLTQVYNDYSGCIYPEGSISSTDEILFNHANIIEICFRGFVNEEELAYKNSLNSYLLNLNNVQNTNSVNNSTVSGIPEIDINTVNLTSTSQESNQTNQQTNSNEVNNNQEPQKKEPKYIFDENGTIIAVE